MEGVFRRDGKWKYLGSFVDENGRQRTRTTGTTDKRSAEGILRKWETDAALRRQGLVDPLAEKIRDEGAKPIGEQLAEYRAMLDAKRRVAAARCRNEKTPCTARG